MLPWSVSIQMKSPVDGDTGYSKPKLAKSSSDRSRGSPESGIEIEAGGFFGNLKSLAGRHIEPLDQDIGTERFWVRFATAILLWRH
jgi:hypothetical protein